MKKFFMLGLVLTTLIISAFAADPLNNNTAVVNAFNKSFSNAKNVQWTVSKDFHRAQFTIDNQVMYAYFTEAGELMAVTRNIKVKQLPIGLSSALSAKYKDHYLADLFEVSSNGESTYYAVVRNGKCEITLQALYSGAWKVFKKVKL